MTGRPLILTPEIAAVIINAIENGQPRHRAAAAVGIHKSTLQRWLAQGEEEAAWPDVTTKLTKQALLAIGLEREVPYIDAGQTKTELANRINAHRSVYRDFRDRLRAGDSRAEAFAIQEARRTGAEDWRFWMTFLERRFPNEWGRRQPDEEIAAVDAGTEEEAQQMLERASEIRIKMLGTG